jgi:hypothetical protein
MDSSLGKCDLRLNELTLQNLHVKTNGMVRAGVFTRVGRLAVARPKAVLGAAAVFFVLAGLAGASVASHLSTGGFDDTG